jgi:hypothetical protein
MNVLTQSELFGTLKTILASKGKMIFTTHAKERIIEREITPENVSEFLSNPVTLLESRVKPEKNDVTYWVRGLTNTVVVAINQPKNTIIVVTVIKNPTHRK